MLYSDTKHRCVWARKLGGASTGWQEQREVLVQDLVKIRSYRGPAVMPRQQADDSVVMPAGGWPALAADRWSW